MKEYILKYYIFIPTSKHWVSSFTPIFLCHEIFIIIFKLSSSILKDFLTQWTGDSSEQTP